MQIPIARAPEIAVQMVREIKQMGFQIELVLADSQYERK